MEKLIDILSFIPLLVSFLGYIAFSFFYLEIKKHFVPLFVFSFIGLTIYFSGILNILMIGTIITFLCGIVLFVLYFKRLKIEGYFNLSTRKLNLFGICFTIGILLFSFLLITSKLIHYDNFSHWAVSLKHILSTDAFPTKDAQLIDFKNYPLGTTSFLYYICFFIGNSDFSMLIGQNILIFACVYAIFAIITEKKRFMLYTILGLGLSLLSFFSITVRINNLLVDFLLPLYTLALFALVYSSRTNLFTLTLTFIPITSFLLIIKNTGIIFAFFAVVYYIYTVAKMTSPKLHKRLLLILLVILLCSLSYIAWEIHQNINFSEVENKFEISTDVINNSKTKSEIKEITQLFIKMSLDITTRPTIGFFATNIVSLLIWLFVKVFMKRNWQILKVLLLLDLVVIAYYLGILALYIFSMPLSEAIILAGFDRYASSIIILFFGGVIMSLVVDIESTLHYKYSSGEQQPFQIYKSITSKQRYQQTVLISTIAMLIVLLSEYYGLSYTLTNYSETLPAKVTEVTGDRWYKDAKVDESRYLAYASDSDAQVTNYYLQYLLRYYLFAPNVDGIVLFYEDNMNNLFSSYDYLVMIESDDNAKFLLQKNFGVDGSEGIYKIVKSDATGKVTLIKVE